VGEAVGLGAGFDDGAVEGEPVDDGRAESGVGEGFGPAGERLVGGDRDGVFLFAFGEDLEGVCCSVESKIRQAWSMRRRCRRVPVSRSSFAGFRFPPDVITLAVRWYLRYGLMPLWMSSRGGRLVSALRFGLEELVDLTGDVAF
jgi:hypothetical protein